MKGGKSATPRKRSNAGGEAGAGLEQVGASGCHCGHVRHPRKKGEGEGNAESVLVN